MLDVREALPTAIYERVSGGAADVGISSGPPPRPLARRLIVHFPIWAYVPVDHRWSRRRSLSVAELATERLIVLGPDHGTRRLLDAAVAEAGTSYGVAATTDVPQIAQALAASGRGVAVVSDDARYGLVGLRIHTGRASRGELRVPLFAAWDESHYAAEAITDLIRDLASWAEKRYGGGADEASVVATSPHGATGASRGVRRLPQRRRREGSATARGEDVPRRAREWP
jgi:hypothetical protein